VSDPGLESRLRARLRRIARGGTGRRRDAPADRAGGAGGRWTTSPEALAAAAGAAAAGRLAGGSRPAEAPPGVEGRLLVWRRPIAGSELQGLEELAGGALADSFVFVDVETCGLGDLPIFLVGLLARSDGGWELRQDLAPDPSAEPELLRRTAAVLGARGDWVSFNGRSFDVPRIRRRCRRHEVEWPEPARHRDLLHEVRRRWKACLPDCRLATVESRLLGLERGPDVPGREVPERYRDFVRTGELRWLAPVIEHNRRDVAALAALLARVLAEDAGPGGER